MSQPLCAENRSEMEAKLVEYVHRQRFLLKLAEEARELFEIINLTLSHYEVGIINRVTLVILSEAKNLSGRFHPHGDSSLRSE